MLVKQANKLIIEPNQKRFFPRNSNEIVIARSRFGGCNVVVKADAFYGKGE